MKWMVILLANCVSVGILVRMRKSMTGLEHCVVYFIAAFICQISLVLADVNLGWLQNKDGKFQQLLIGLDSIAAFPSLVTIWMNGVARAIRNKKWWYLLGAFLSVEAMESLEVGMGLYAWKSVEVRLMFDLSWVVLLAVTWGVWWLYQRYALRRGVRL